MTEKAINIYIGNHGKSLYVEDWIHFLTLSFRAVGYEVSVSMKAIELDKVNLVLECFNESSFSYFRDKAKAGAKIILIASEFLTGNTFNDFSGDRAVAASNDLEDKMRPWDYLKNARSLIRAKIEKRRYLETFQ